ncbi:MAG: DEAD/DEAH box helicase [Vicinamibacterales bacterium]
MSSPATSLVDLLHDAQWDPTSDRLLDYFLRYTSARGLSLYPAQEEAVLELLDGSNVILNTPTGSGKSLVASALIFSALARGKRAVYTCPIKALVNEKWMALCREFGPDLVGLSTGDASVNRDAPVLCCTAEVLANIALREGAGAPFDDVVMDEFHYYADRDRGSAWQVPLLTMTGSRFLLMSATLGDTRFFEEAVTRLNGRPTRTIKSGERPVPLEYAYSEIPLAHTIEKLVDEQRTPAYVVHFTQADAASSAQDFTSLKICTKEEKAEIAARIASFEFSSPYGADVRKWLRHGIGLHHAGLLPKYRVLVEQLAQAGLLKVICGTDTLGAGINVPIRTVLFTRLCKFDGQKTAILSARDFHQIAGRAGRKGFDDRGYVVVQAPEHVIENIRLKEKSQRDGKKVTLRKPPEHNFVSWDLNTFKRLMGAQPEQLVSRFQVSHGMLLNVLSRRTDGCRAMQRIVRDSHEAEGAKRQHRRRAWQLFRALVSRHVIEFIPRTPEGAKLRVNVDLQEDFSMDQALSLYLLETLPLLDRDAPEYALDVLTLVESILENPELILRKQLDRVKDEAIATWKAEGMEYEQRMEEIEKLEYPKPLRDFVYETFNAFAERHPWVGEDNIRPKSIAREMFEHFRSFAEYVLDYELQRSEGLLLRHLNSVYKVLSQTVPDAAKTDEVREMELYLRTLLRAVDSSLEDEWERMRDPNYRPLAGAGRATTELRPPGADEALADITRDTKAFTALVRTRIFTFLRAWSIGDHGGALATLDAADGGVEDGERAPAWTVDQLKGAIEAYRAGHGTLRFDPEARNLRHTHVTVADHGRNWHVQQVLVDPEQENDWMAEFDVDLVASRERSRAVVVFKGIGPIG